MVNLYIISSNLSWLVASVIALLYVIASVDCFALFYLVKERLAVVHEQVQLKFLV